MLTFLHLSPYLLPHDFLVKAKKYGFALDMFIDTSILILDPFIIKLVLPNNEQLIEEKFHQDRGCRLKIKCNRSLNFVAHRLSSKLFGKLFFK